eukprot:TRINITY_DN1996_c0_g1_i6.p1 TRINITY_DN1996_c0_g1~~TRINITY_DN1996_c0_g1_i6.p1  ORF type:complete len:109 (+),score=55.09 TRINITY_DN1996_c0_g1_i6:115-441(+)
MLFYYLFFFFFLMIRRPPRSTLSSSSAASDVYKRQVSTQSTGDSHRAMPSSGYLRILNSSTSMIRACLKPDAAAKAAKHSQLSYVLQMWSKGEKEGAAIESTTYPAKK